MSIALRSAAWNAEGRTEDGYAVACWRGAFSGALVVRVTYPDGGRFRAIAQAAATEEQAIAFAEDEIGLERARRAGGAP